jgi:hypothetical protein
VVSLAGGTLLMSAIRVSGLDREAVGGAGALAQADGGA